MIKKKEIPTIFDIIGSTVNQLLKVVGIDLDKEPEAKKVLAPVVKEVKPTKKEKVKSKTYQVYLALPENNTTHTTLKKIQVKDEILYKLDYNKKIYKQSEIEGFKDKPDWKPGVDVELNAISCNFMFLDIDGKLSLGKARFTEKAQEIINERETDKLADRSFETTHFAIQEKYTLINNNDFTIPTIILIISISLLLFFAIPKMLDIMNTVNNNAASSYAEKARIDAIPYTIEINETINGTNITRT